MCILYHESPSAYLICTSTSAYTYLHNACYCNDINKRDLSGSGTIEGTSVFLIVKSISTLMIVLSHWCITMYKPH